MEKKVVETNKLPFGVMVNVKGVLYLGKYKENKTKTA